MHDVLELYLRHVAARGEAPSRRPRAEEKAPAAPAARDKAKAAKGSGNGNKSRKG